MAVFRQVRLLFGRQDAQSDDIFFVCLFLCFQVVYMFQLLICLERVEHISTQEYNPYVELCVCGPGLLCDDDYWAGTRA